MSKEVGWIRTPMSRFNKQQRKRVEESPIGYEYVHTPCIYTSIDEDLSEVSRCMGCMECGWGIEGERVIKRPNSRDHPTKEPEGLP